ncbi:MAG: 30S ribosomal protein S12 methylthiotransferase RimO [Anaerolineaceae bacterium]|nr:30S ribosomal protein S12 methylthiotransferase RimO [Anaerolineaceae bacterium]MCB9101649.1 30S ribosomal protein S12 methylthiotransferase RimO [Anaerolineales bacterium]
MAKKRRKEPTFYLRTLGCPKNTFDSEGISEMLLQADYRSTDNPRQADVMIVNTCGFLQAAKDESIGALRELAGIKRKHQLLIAAGCMAQRFGSEVTREVRGLDGLIGTRAWTDIVPFIQQLRANKRPQPLYHLPETGDTPIETVALDRQQVEVGRASAYLKISDGCSAPCAFCTIPSFKGLNRSRPREHILAEARRLAAAGVKEIILIAQDTTAYGRDWGELDGLPALLEQLVAAAPGVNWWRLMYAYPGHASDKLVEVMAAHSQIIPYIDMPLQHGHPDTLKRMRRPHNVDKLLGWIEQYRTSMPGAVLRTTFIVGYPGETEAEFQGLLDFMAAVKFDRVGAFTFSPEPGTPAFDLPDPIDRDIQEDRWERLMAFQQPISLERNRQMVGQRLEVLIDGAGDGLSIARSYRDAPEIDGYVVVEKELPVGQMMPVLVTGAMEYDLVAMPADQPILVM